jgi:hypothetical protein
MMFAGVQSGRSPHPSNRKRFMTACPFTVWDTSGWN